MCKIVWWCAECGRVVADEDVTYCESHDERVGGCGHEVEVREVRTEPFTTADQAEEGK